VIVVDASDPERGLQLSTTLELIDKMGAGHVPRLCVFNKLDRLDPAIDERGDIEELAGLCGTHPWIALSTRDARAVTEFEATILALVRSQEEERSVFVPYSAASTLSLVYANCRVVDSQANETGVTFRLHAPTAVLSRIAHALEGGN
jgi:GTP-binding protein HflX